MKTKHFFFPGSVLVALALLFPGCLTTSPADKALFQAIDTAWQQVGPEYVGYVNADPMLDAQSKVTRTRTAELISKALEAAKGPAVK